MQLTETIARSIAATDYDSIPPAVRDKTKLSILDTLGVMVPPSSLDQTCERLAEIVSEESGPGQSTLIGLGKKASAVMAAYLNGSFAHVLDYDDTIDELGHHPSSQTVPAALAVAERMGDASGKELITAVAVGSDLGARLSSSPTGKLGVDHRWFPISNFGVFSATAAAGKMLRLDEAQLVNALGLALHRCHGQLDAIAAPESELRAIRDGFINKEGVLCALLAGSGVKACRNG
ncbi:MAG: MmgE/PrpD family protein, partial [Gammaproteobacteria bacterium]|nr:MmgE/PrpD family protein [Gammaproteobacteria bacterium]